MKWFPRQMNHFAEIVVLFHALVGLCVGWVWGSRTSVLGGISMCVVGCAMGLVSGFLISCVPRACGLVGANLTAKFRLLALMLVASGLTAAVAFWVACYNCIRS
jgi:hypothetical protein